MHVEVITPSKFGIERTCRLVVLPTAEGELGIEEGHAHMMATLVPGEMRIYDDAEALVWAISGGVAEARPMHVLVLADAIEERGDIDLERAQLARQRAESRLKSPPEGMDLDRVQKALSRAINRIRIAGRR